jgi:hypothetical protein
MKSDSDIGMVAVVRRIAVLDTAEQESDSVSILGVIGIFAENLLNNNLVH